ncbi:MAG: hypothetical protein OXR66_01475 [Candidatus Woesearchaeota archaeon]|nr:hypothetical protein [Candidatus Woesearchaeota archaeon]
MAHSEFDAFVLAAREEFGNCEEQIMWRVPEEYLVWTVETEIEAGKPHKLIGLDQFEDTLSGITSKVLTSYVVQRNVSAETAAARQEPDKSCFGVFYGYHGNQQRDGVVWTRTQIGVLETGISEQLRDTRLEELAKTRKLSKPEGSLVYRFE